MNTDTIMDYVVDCAGGCGLTWLWGRWDTPESVISCIWCGEDFCSDRCHDEHHPCADHPGPCPNKECESEDGLEPLDGVGLICGDCREVVETGRG